MGRIWKTLFISTDKELDNSWKYWVMSNVLRNSFENNSFSFKNWSYIPKISVALMTECWKIWLPPLKHRWGVLTETKCDGCQGRADENVGEKKIKGEMIKMFWALWAGAASMVSALSEALFGERACVLTPNRHRRTRSLVDVELVCVGTVQGVGDLAISSHVWIGSRDLQHKRARGRVLHHRLRVHQLEQEDNNNHQDSICIALFPTRAKCSINRITRLEGLKRKGGDLNV